MNAFTSGGVLNWASKSPSYKRPNLYRPKSPPIVGNPRTAEAHALSILNYSKYDMLERMKKKSSR